MGDIQVKNIPDDLHERLQRQARKREVSLNDVVLSMLERRLSRIEAKEYLDKKLAGIRADQRRHLTR